MSEAGVLAVLAEGDDALWERDGDVTAIDGLLARAAAGSSGALFIAGDAGLGKSALLAKARLMAAARGFLVTAGIGKRIESKVPLGLINQVFMDLDCGTARPATALPPALGGTSPAVSATARLRCAGPSGRGGSLS